MMSLLGFWVFQTGSNAHKNGFLHQTCRKISFWPRMSISFGRSGDNI